MGTGTFDLSLREKMSSWVGLSVYSVAVFTSVDAVEFASCRKFESKSIWHDIIFKMSTAASRVSIFGAPTQSWLERISEGGSSAI